MNKLFFVTIFTLLLAMSFASARVADYCAEHVGSDEGTFYQNLQLEGKTISVYKTDSNKDLCDYNNFCESKGMQWYAPQSGEEADYVLTTVRALDNYHTWIISKSNTVLGSNGQATWNNQILTTIDSPNCVSGSSSGFSAIRDWGCSMCEPEQYGTTKCWDNDHSYDWILCEGEYTPNNDVPEFGLIGGGLVVLGGLGFLIFKKKIN